MELENIILSVVTHSQKNTHGMYSLVSVILGQKLRIPKKQFTDHMKLKKKEDQSVDASVLFRTKYSWEEIWRQSVEQRLKERTSRDCPHLGIYPIHSHQTQTLLWMPTSAC